MKIEFDIPEEKVNGLHDPGKRELLKRCKKWTEDIIDEAARIESSRNETDEPDITAAIINEATLHERRFPLKRKINWRVKLTQIGAFITTLVTGSLLDTEKFNKTSHVVWFLVFFFLAIASTIYLTFNSEQNG